MIKTWSYIEEYRDYRNKILKSIDKTLKSNELFFGKQIEKFEVEEIPENLVEQEVSILKQGIKEDEKNQNKKDFEKKAKERIKVGLILNAFGEENKIHVHENEVQSEIQKQLKMMPGQEKIVMDYYQKNPSATESLRGTIYEDKIIQLIKTKVKVNKKEISKEEAEKILKSAHDHSHDDEHNDSSEEKKEKKTVSSKKTSVVKKAKSPSKKTTKAKKVSKK